MRGQLALLPLVVRSPHCLRFRCLHTHVCHLAWDSGVANSQVLIVIINRILETT